jgi:hypothetical protein
VWNSFLFFSIRLIVVLRLLVVLHPKASIRDSRVRKRTVRLMAPSFSYSGPARLCHLGYAPSWLSVYRSIPSGA